jgi:hypothetical protein
MLPLDAGIGEVDVDSPVAFDRGLDVKHCVLVAGHIGTYRADATGSDRVGRIAQRALIEIYQQHLRPFLDEAFRRGAANAARASCNDRNSTVELAHSPMPPLQM